MERSGDVSALTLEIRPGEQVLIDGGRVAVTLEHKSGQVARLKFLAPKSVEIHREARKNNSVAAVARGGIRNLQGK